MAPAVPDLGTEEERAAVYYVRTHLADIAAVLLDVAEGNGGTTCQHRARRILHGLGVRTIGEMRAQIEAER